VDLFGTFDQLVHIFALMPSSDLFVDVDLEIEGCIVESLDQFAPCIPESPSGVNPFVREMRN
jgi:hypothetical protein